MSPTWTARETPVIDLDHCEDQMMPDITDQVVEDVLTVNIVSEMKVEDTNTPTSI